MNSSAVVILTDPARCEQVDPQTLVHALQEVQQLNQAGVPESRAFCDHPAAAMDFIDAYARAYPELQLDSPDLPLPQQLYSMVADGRLDRLQASGPRAAEKPVEASQLYPLYVLSLGTPETLMQALQESGFANDSIRLLEIAPIDESTDEDVSVAEAVERSSIARPSWLREDSNEAHRDDTQASRSDELETSEPMTGVEIDLDRIEVSRPQEAREREQGEALDQAAPPAVENAASDREHQPTEDERQTRVDEEPSERTSGSDAAASSSTSSESASDARPASSSESRAVAEPVERPPDDSERDGGEQPADPPDQAAPDGDSETDQDPETDGDQDPKTDGEQDPTAEGEQSAQAGVDPDVRIDDRDMADEAAPEREPASVSFADPGEDVTYPPAGSLLPDDDLSYDLPAGDDPGASIFDHVLRVSGDAEVVDLEALSRELSGPAADRVAAPADLDDAVLTQAPDQGALSSDLPDGGSAESDQDEGHNPVPPAVHDTDI